MLTFFFLTLFLAQPGPNPAPRLAEAARLLEEGRPAPALPIVDQVLSEQPRLPEALVLRALLLDALHRPKSAQTAYETALKVLPNDARLLRLFGEHWLRRGQKDQAIALLERGLALAPADENLRARLAEARAAPSGAAPAAGSPSGRAAGAPAPGADPYALVQQANAYVERGEYQRGLDIVDGLIKQYPQSKSSHLLRALALDGLGRTDEAKLSYEAALRIAPKDPQTLFLLGKHHLKRELWDDAVRCFEESLAAAPDDVDTLFYLAQARYRTIKKGKVLEAIERCAVLAPNNPTVLVKLGQYRADAGLAAPALEALLKAQSLNPDEPDLDLALGIVELNVLDVNAARSALERAARRDPDNLAVLSGLAEAATQARDHAAAKRYYQTLLDRGQREAACYLGLGKALVGLGENQAAIDPLKRAIELNPKLSEVHFHLARAYRAAGQVDESQRELRIFSALKQNPFGPFEDRPEPERAVWNRIEALVKEGKEAEAVRMIATEFHGEQSASFWLGALYYTLGRYRDAERLLEQAIQATPTLPKARAYLCLAYLADGRLADGERVIAEEIAQNPKDALVLMASGKVQFAKKNWGEAVRLLQESRVVESEVQLMICEAQLQSGQRDQAQETAQIIAALSTTNTGVRAALERLLARFQLRLDSEPTPAATPK